MRRFGRQGLRSARSNRKKKPKLWWLAALLVAVALVFLLGSAWLERRADPQIANLAKLVATREASAAVASAVKDVLLAERVSYENLVAFAPQSNGVQAIETNALEVNLLRAKMNGAVEAALEHRRANLKLPLGTLLGSKILAGLGPGFSIPLRMTGHAVSDIRSEFKSSGLNQSLHRILMDLHVTLAVIWPGETQEVEIKLTVSLAETVIIGSVPGALITQK